MCGRVTPSTANPLPCVRGDVAIVWMLLDAGANSRTQTGEGLRPPHYVVKAKSKKVLIKTRTDLSARTPPPLRGVESFPLFILLGPWLGG